MPSLATTTAQLDVGRKWPAIIMIGAITGLLSGLLGIGGAAILVPGMVDLLGLSQHRATGTSLFVIIPTAAVSAVVYALGSQMDWPLVALFSVTAVIGATSGARVTAFLSAVNLRRLFGVFLLFAAIRLIIPGGTGAGAPPAHILAQDPVVTIGEAVLGFVAGFLSGLLGIGGGQVLTPGMIFFLNFPQKLAQGISLAFIVPTAISGALTHYRRGNVDARAGMLLMPSSFLCGIVGSALAQYAPSSALRLGFGIFLLYASARMLAPKAVDGVLKRLAGRA